MTAPVPADGGAATGGWADEETVERAAIALADWEGTDFMNAKRILKDSLRETARGVLTAVTPDLAALLSQARAEGAAEERERIEVWLRELADKAAATNSTEGSALQSVAADIRWAANRLADLH